MAVPPLQIKRAVQLLYQGAIIAYPTEAVWGLGCDPNNQRAVHRLLALKQRPGAKGLILVAASVQQFAILLDGLAPALVDKFSSHIGAVTWLVPANKYAAKWITGEHNSIALRVSTHQPVVELCTAFAGPLVSTSANLAGKPPAHWPWQLHRLYGHGLDYIVPGSLGAPGRPSEIRDLMTDKVIRPA